MVGNVGRVRGCCQPAQAREGLRRRDGGKCSRKARPACGRLDRRSIPTERHANAGRAPLKRSSSEGGRLVCNSPPPSRWCEGDTVDASFVCLDNRLRAGCAETEGFARCLPERHWRAAMKLFPRLVAEEAAEYGGRVRVLPPEVAHRIAAGEVIERPASAVKELVENSLDAGATRVEVEIEGGGISLLRVRDDGSGMSPEDAERAVAEHATSKIQTADDLARVVSLGFRGEALHAIGSVSSLTLTTRERGAEDPEAPASGSSPGRPLEAAPAAHPPGTTVEARDLFLNLPVRRGFLGTDGPRRTPSRRSSGARPEPARGRLLPALGRAAACLPCPPRRTCGSGSRRYTASRWRGASSRWKTPWCGGFVSPLSVSFPTRRYLHVAVNGRVVDTDSFAPAIAKAYADLLPKGPAPGGVSAAGARPRRGGRERAPGEERGAAARRALRVSARGRDHQGRPRAGTGWRGRRSAEDLEHDGAHPHRAVRGQMHFGPGRRRSHHPGSARGARAYPLRAALKRTRGRRPVAAAEPRRGAAARGPRAGGRGTSRSS